MSAQEKISVLYQGPTLSESEMLKVEAMISNYENKQIYQVIGYPNIDTTDEEDVPSGMLVIHPIDAPVHPDSIPEKSFSYLVLCPVKADKELRDDDFQINEKLDEAVPQYSENPPSMYNRNEKNQDIAEWQAELGEDGFAGIFKKVKENGRSADYYVGVCAGASKACTEFKDYLNSLDKDEPMTFQQLLDDPKFSYVKALAQRNAKRLAYNVARAFNVKIRHVRDISAVGAPMRAEPAHGYQQAQSTIKVLDKGFKSREAVGVYHNVRPTQEANDMCFVYAGPYDGIAMFNMNGNARGHALPATTGRQQQQLMGEATKYPESRNKGVTWTKTKLLSDQHSDLHPDAFRPINDTFLEHMKSMGWRQTGTNNREYLVPVALKISNPELLRKN